MSVLIVLGLVWAVVLIPPVLRSRSQRRIEFIDSFRQQMGALGAPPPESKPRRSQAPATPARRRREVLGVLLGAMAVALVVGSIPSLRGVWAGGLFLFNAFLVYVGLLVRQQDPARRLQARRVPATPSEPSGAAPARAERTGRAGMLAGHAHLHPAR